MNAIGDLDKFLDQQDKITSLLKIDVQSELGTLKSDVMKNMKDFVVDTLTVSLNN